MPILKIIFVAIVLQSFILIQGYEYCAHEAKLCGSSQRHIVCHKEQITPGSKYVKHYVMTDYFRDVITYWHNHYRNEVACGRVNGKDGKFPTAREMRELVWDYELEYIASVHASRCKLEHDQCRNSYRIATAGQNLAYKSQSGKVKFSPLGRAHESITSWFKESADAPISIIDKFETNPDVKIGHFTVLANDRVGRLGCAMVLGKSFDGKHSSYNYVTCNYDFTNIIGAAVYRKGPSASHCKLYGDYGKSSNFSCLCAKTFNKDNHTAWF